MKPVKFEPVSRSLPTGLSSYRSTDFSYTLRLSLERACWTRPFHLDIPSGTCIQTNAVAQALSSRPVNDIMYPGYALLSDACPYEQGGMPQDSDAKSRRMNPRTCLSPKRKRRLTSLWIPPISCPTKFSAWWLLAGHTRELADGGLLKLQWALEWACVVRLAGTRYEQVVTSHETGTRVAMTLGRISSAGHQSTFHFTHCQYRSSTFLRNSPCYSLLGSEGHPVTLTTGSGGWSAFRTFGFGFSGLAVSRISSVVPATLAGLCLRTALRMTFARRQCSGGRRGHQLATITAKRTKK